MTRLIFWFKVKIKKLRFWLKIQYYSWKYRKEIGLLDFTFKHCRGHYHFVGDEIYKLLITIDYTNKEGKSLGLSIPLWNRRSDYYRARLLSLIGLLNSPEYSNLYP